MSEKQARNKAAEVSDAEFAELKRDMRSAKLLAWMEANAQSLIAGAIALALVLVGAGLWFERSKTERASAATLYQQALNEKAADKKITLLQKLVGEFSGSAYAVMAEMLLARYDVQHAAAHLQAVIDADNAMPEWRWQARLDLAELKLMEGDKAAARALLAEKVGKQYEQLRRYLLAEASENEQEKREHLQKALDAPSLDEDLMRKIERMLSVSPGEADKAS